jgi:hypothetical protein
METQYLYMDFLQGFKEEYEVKDTCTEEEVSEIETGLGIKFPRSYREVYLILGKWYGFGVIDDNGYRFPDYKGMRDGAEEIISSDGIDWQLNENNFVFGVFAENGVFYFFNLDEGEDPPVYVYEGGAGAYTLSAVSFSSFVQQQIWYEGYLIGKKRKGK